MNYLDIALKGSDQKTHTLGDYKGRKVILYFYPKDNTSGCTLQAQAFTQTRSQFEALGYTIIGVSRDSLKSHENFIVRQNLNILLLSDPEDTLIQAFDVLKEKKMYGKTFMGIERSTFILNEHGEIIHSYRKVSAKDHAEMLLETLKA